MIFVYLLYFFVVASLNCKPETEMLFLPSELSLVYELEFESLLQIHMARVKYKYIRGKLINTQ